VYRRKTKDVVEAIAKDPEPVWGVAVPTHDYVSGHLFQTVCVLTAAQPEAPVRGTYSGKLRQASQVRIFGDVGPQQAFAAVTSTEHVLCIHGIGGSTWPPANLETVVAMRNLHSEPLT
jgi:hypothetical protein